MKKTMPKTCTHEKCENPRWARGFCLEHDRLNNPEKYRIKPKPAKPQEPRKPIKKFSDKREARNRLYLIQNKAFLIRKPYCEIRLPGCSGRSTEVHHLYSGRNRDKYFLIETEWLASCSQCHHCVHCVLSEEQAIELGLKKVEK